MTLTGSGFASDGLSCRFGTEVVMAPLAVLMTASSVACVAPPAGEDTRVDVEVSINSGRDYTNSGVQFIFEAAPVTLIP